MKCFKPYFKSICSFGMLMFMNATALFAQQRPVEMADVMRGNGKIYIVVAVVVTIFAGIVVFLLSTEQKVKQLEKRVEEMKSEK